jgi:hypothetical protein
MLTVVKPGVPAIGQIMANRRIIPSLLIGLLLVAFALRVYRLSSIPINVDEISTITKYAPLPVIEIFEENHSNNHPLTSLLARLFSPQTDHLFMMRWPSILIGMVSLPFVYRLGADLFGRKVGLLALLLVSTSPVHAGYSVVIRGYIGLMALILVSLYLLRRALRRNRWRDWLGFVGISVLVIHFHLFSLLAIGSQVGLVGLWLIWNVSKKKELSLKPTLIRFGLIVALLIIIYPPLIYARTNSIILNERWPNDFVVWQDDLFSLPEDLSPLWAVASLMAPITPGGIGIYLYLAFWAVGLYALWFRHRALTVGVIIWFLTPFVAIFVALQVLGQAFYAFLRFLLYLLPPFLILVAQGMVMVADWLSALTMRWGRPGPVAARLIGWGAAGALLTMIGFSMNWYLLTGTHTDWQGMSRTLSAHLQPQDMTICEEHQRGFALPDRAKPHCMWMLDFLVPQLRGLTYTPRFQSSTDFVADYEQLRRQRLALLAPGSVWLIIWQKIPFHPGQLITDQKPSVLAPPPLAEFEPYRAWHFGSASLVQIDSEATLFGNVYKSLELLLRVEPKPADRARYVRSLADMEAVQGHKQPAQAYFEESWRLVEQAGAQYPADFLDQTRQAIERIPAADPPPGTAAKIQYRVGAALCLQSFEVTPAILQAGRPLQLDLYWQTLDLVEANYTFFLRLEAGPAQTPARLEFRPFDGVYPTPWWWPGQQLTEQHDFVLPGDLLPQDYTVTFGAYDGQQPEAMMTLPLLVMRYRPDEAGSPRWRVEPASSPLDECVQSQ